MAVIKLGRIQIVTYYNALTEALGDPVESVGRAVVPSERKGRAVNLELPVRGRNEAYNADYQRVEGNVQRRQVRSLMENTAARLDGLYFLVQADPELSGWLALGSGSLEMLGEHALARANYKLILEECFKIGTLRTDRDARRISIRDKRTGAAARDYLRTIYSTDFSTITPLALACLPSNLTNVFTANQKVLPSLLRTTRSGDVFLAPNRVHNEIVSFDQAEADMGESDVVLYDRYLSPDATFDGRFEFGRDKGNWTLVEALSESAQVIYNSADPSKIFNGIVSAKVTVRPNDKYLATSGERCEFSRSGSTMPNGTERWASFWTYFPSAEFNPNNNTTWNIFWQVHFSGGAGTQANINMRINKVAGVEKWHAVVYGGNPASPTIGTLTTNVAPLRDTRLDWLVHWKHSTGADGLFECWLNGVKLFEYVGPNFFTDATGTYEKLGWYRDDTVGVTTAHYVGGYRSGPTKESVIYNPAAEMNEVYGPDYPLTPNDGPVMDNGICRVSVFKVNSPAGGRTLLFDTWEVGTGWVEQGRMGARFEQPGTTYTNIDTFVSAQVVEWTAEMAVVKYVFKCSAQPTWFADVYVTLGRGWLGPRIEIYGRWDRSDKPGIDLQYQPATTAQTSIVFTLDPLGSASSAVQARDDPGNAWGGQTVRTMLTTDNPVISLQAGPGDASPPRLVSAAVARASISTHIWGDSFVYGGTSRRGFSVRAPYSDQTLSGYCSMWLFFSPIRIKMYEAESFMVAAGTRSLVADANAAPGSGNSAVQDTQTSNAAATLNVPSATLDALAGGGRAKYLVWVRIVAPTASDVVSASYRFGAQGYVTTRTWNGTTYRWVNLGELTRGAGEALDVAIWRSSGTGSVRIDRLFLVPTERRVAGFETYDGVKDSDAQTLYDQRAIPVLLAR